MVLLHVKKKEESLFLFETTLTTEVKKVLDTVVAIHNGRNKVMRLLAELDDLSKHGITMDPRMQGLVLEQIKELKLVDEYEEQCIPSGGFAFQADVCLRRNGRAPTKAMKEVIAKASEEAKYKIHRDRVKEGKCLTLKTISESLELLDGAVKIVYPMGIPPYDPVRMELENCEVLGHHDADQVLDPASTTLWFTVKQMQNDKLLKDYLGGNEKTKAVVKLAKLGAGAPCREPRLSEEERKQIMLLEHRKREELKKLVKDDDQSFYNEDWADNTKLANTLQVTALKLHKKCNDIRIEMSEEQEEELIKAKEKTKAKGKDKGEEGKGSSTPDILSEAAMTNAYYICHNVQDLMYFRGFVWDGAKSKGKAGKKKKR